MQNDYKRLSDAGVGLATISYDSRETLQRFAAKHQIEYPMLSDAGSKVIRSYGILNTNIPPSLKKFYGIPFPGQYLISTDGVVRDKQFLPNYEHRPTASEALFKNFGGGGDNVAVVKAEDVEARIELSESRAFPGQEIGVAVNFTIAPGWHIYGQPIPTDYTATTVSLSGDAIARQSVDFPPAQPLMVPALNQMFAVYTGRVRALGRMLLKGTLKPGKYQIGGSVSFQECNDQICKIPQTVAFTLPITIEPFSAAR